ARQKRPTRLERASSARKEALRVILTPKRRPIVTGWDQPPLLGSPNAPGSAGPPAGTADSPNPRHRSSQPLTPPLPSQTAKRRVSWTGGASAYSVVRTKATYSSNLWVTGQSTWWIEARMRNNTAAKRRFLPNRTRSTEDAPFATSIWGRIRRYVTAGAQHALKRGSYAGACGR